MLLATDSGRSPTEYGPVLAQRSRPHCIPDLDQHVIGLAATVDRGAQLHPRDQCKDRCNMWLYVTLLAMFGDGHRRQVGRSVRGVCGVSKPGSV